VAVVDISFLESWFNVTMENCEVTLQGPLSDPIRTHIPLNNYKDVSALVSALNLLIKTTPLHSNFRIRDDGRAVLKLHPQEQITLHDITAAMMGFMISDFKQDPTSNGITWHAAVRPPNVHLPLQNIYIYSNIVENIAVGDTYAPLLQVVPVQTNVYGSVQHHQFLNPLYMSLSTDELSVIEVKLCDDRGNEIDFAVGNVILKLHFRKVK